MEILGENLELSLEEKLSCFYVYQDLWGKSNFFNPNRKFEQEYYNFFIELIRKQKIKLNFYKVNCDFLKFFKKYENKYEKIHEVYRNEPYRYINILNALNDYMSLYYSNIEVNKSLEIPIKIDISNKLICRLYNYKDKFVITNNNETIVDLLKLIQLKEFSVYLCKLEYENPMVIRINSNEKCLEILKEFITKYDNYKEERDRKFAEMVSIG